MKTYEEMAKEVFRRRKKYKEKQNDRREMIKLWLVSVLFAFILSSTGAVLLIHRFQTEDVLLMTISPEKTTGEEQTVPENTTRGDQTVPVETTEVLETEKNHGVEICLLNAFTKKEEPLREGIRFPLNMYLEIEDIRGLTREEEAEVSKEKWRKLDRIHAEVGDKALANLLVTGDEDTLIAFYTIGGFVLNIEDYDAIDCITLKGTSNGKVGVYLVKDGQYLSTRKERGIDITAEQLYYNLAGYKYGVNVLWDPSYPIFDRIYENPEMDLSEINDTMQIIIWYVNGDVDVYTIDIFFDQEGVCYAMIADDEIEQ